jgi:hypothetical protein
MAVSERKIGNNQFSFLLHGLLTHFIAQTNALGLFAAQKKGQP